MVDLKMILGTINYNDFIRVSAEKVSAPGVEVYSQYFNTPVSNLTFVIPGLEPDNYYINFRDSPGSPTLGTLVSQAFVNALTGEWLYERRFYTIGALPGGVTSTINSLTDPYLIGKNVTGIFKENFRYLELTAEYLFDDTIGKIDLVNTGQIFSATEKFIVEIKYNVGTSNTTIAAGLFTDTVSVTGAAYTLLSTDKFKRHSLDCAGTKQVINLCPVSSLVKGDFFLFEHKRSGVQKQTKIVVDGTDKIYYNGFELPGSNLLTEIWVSKGRSLYLRKDIIAAVSYWEVIGEYDGINVGSRMKGIFKSMPCWLPETGLLCDGDELPALYWWIRNVLPGNHYVTDDNVASGLYVHPVDRKGQFVIHSTGKAFRLPNTQGLSGKGLKDFLTYAGDADRLYDYPGGNQVDQNKEHGHGIATTNGAASGNNTADPVRGTVAGSVAATEGIEWTTGLDNKTIRKSGGDQVRVRNTGEIHFVHI